MTFIDELYPWTVVDQRKYMQYVKLRKERDRFLKSLKPGWYGEWVIHKKLIEAGGLGDTVYILPARGSGTSFRTLKDIEDGWERIHQYELYPELINPWHEPLYQQLFKDFYPDRPYSYEPSWTIDPYGHIRLREVSLVRKPEFKEERE